MSDFSEIAPPSTRKQLLTAAQVQSGPPIQPLERILLYSPDDWEEFIDEWASSRSGAYISVQRFTGANDRGIDIAGFASADKLNGVWDNYQCKHYDHSLHPSDAWPEIGKILWHSFQGQFQPPRAYYFVAPRDVGTQPVRHSFGLGRPENKATGAS